MWPVLGGLISGGASLLGGMFSAQQSQQNTQEQIAGQEAMQQQSETFNANQAEINRQYQTQMSNTAYQRSAQDMEAAGLNPAAMFGSGSAASTPSGSTASTGTPTMPTPQTKSALGGVGEAVNKAVSTAIDVKTFDKMSDEIANLRATAARTAAETATEREKPELVRSEAVGQQNRNQLLAAAYPAAKFSAKSAEDLNSMPDWLRKSLNIGSYSGNKVGDTIAPIFSSAKSLRGLFPSRETTERTSDGMGGNFTDKWSGLYR